MDKRTCNRWINRGLFPFFVGSLWSGFGLHAAGHAARPDAWHLWAAVHAVVSLAFAGFVAAHIRGHWGWYRALKTAGCKGHRRRMVLWLTALFLLTAATGIGLLFRGDAPGARLGIFHWITGLALGVLCLLHLFQRVRTAAKTAPRTGGR